MTSFSAMAQPANAFTLTTEGGLKNVDVLDQNQIQSIDAAPEDLQNYIRKGGRYQQQYVNTERNDMSADVGNHVLDPNKMVLQFPHQVSAYFINEGAGYRNQLGFTATKDGEVLAEKLIFEDVSSPESVLSNSNGPLNIGDSMNLGQFDAGTKFDFWLASNGRSNRIYGADASENPDGKQHLIAYYDSDYVVLGFEDIHGGGDLDYNDTVFAVDFGKDNSASMADVPEPTSAVAFLGLAGVGLMGLRRRQS
ncbi:DUF4114 domain-containing protein [Geitlerinema sp. PCC 9228]|uniref:DUF4114 domain-containing protein n=1 Tax=Geitlerinema sp. PCC 9228 TaxID=111611 RepID=UPI00147BF738|nr:DUF4114 domain-containing protein [Geitlerinema sp. PCC 9228]